MNWSKRLLRPGTSFSSASRRWTCQSNSLSIKRPINQTACQSNGLSIKQHVNQTACQSNGRQHGCLTAGWSQHGYSYTQAFYHLGHRRWLTFSIAYKSGIAGSGGYSKKIKYHPLQVAARCCTDRPSCGVSRRGRGQGRRWRGHGGWGRYWSSGPTAASWDLPSPPEPRYLHKRTGSDTTQLSQLSTFFYFLMLFVRVLKRLWKQMSK